MEPKLEAVTNPMNSSLDITRTLSEHNETSVSRKPSRRYGFFIVIASLFFGTFLVALDTTIIGTATPAITTAFHAMDDIAWYGSGYLLTLTALQPSFGKIFTLWDVKVIYLSCILIFEGGSIICASSPSSTAFIVGRAIQGCGAAGIFQGALVIITNQVPLAKRPFYISVVISSFGLCVKIGPLLGGVLTDRASWRWCFWINIPIGVVVIALIVIFLKLDSDKEVPPQRPLMQKLKEIDFLGMIMIIASITCLLLAMQWGGQKLPWRSSDVVGLLVGSGLLLIIFMMTQWKFGDHATLPFSILLQRSIASGSLYLFAFAMPTYVYGFYVPIYFQSIKGVSATRSGINFLVLALPQVAFTVLSGWLASKFGYYTPYLIGGTAVSIIGSALLTTLKPETTLGTWVAYFLVVAFGTGISINHPYTAVQAVLEDSRIPIGNAIMQFTFSLGGAVSLCIAQTVFANSLATQVAYLVPSISIQQVVAAGASGLPALAGNSKETLDLLRLAYSKALRDVFIFALIAGVVAFKFSMGVEHKNIKQVAKRSNGQTPTQS